MVTVITSFSKSSVFKTVKSHGYRDYIVFEKLRFQNVFLSRKNSNQCFQISPVWRASSKSSVSWRIYNVDDRSNNRNEAAFSNWISLVYVWTLPYTGYHSPMPLREVSRRNVITKKGQLQRNRSGNGQERNLSRSDHLLVVRIFSRLLRARKYTTSLVNDIPTYCQVIYSLRKSLNNILTHVAFQSSQWMSFISRVVWYRVCF